MKDPVGKYLERRTQLDRWPLTCGSLEGLEQVVVIPALAEGDYLFATLDRLAQNDRNALEKTLVICVVNNRAEPHCARALIEENARTLARLEAVRHHHRLRLAYVDASSPGRELPPKDGVGLARKIGLDWGLVVLSRTKPGLGLLFCLDADTLVQANYLTAVRDAFMTRGLWAGVVDYAHPLDGPEEETAAIVAYELFLRYHVLGLHYAGSPYAFPTIGSTMVCRTEAYVAVSGMNRRRAGEDFYFLQELAKTGGVQPILETTVFPSARISGRVPFGTGARVARYRGGKADAYTLYHPEGYRILRRWLALVESRLDRSGNSILQEASRIAVPLSDFLLQNGFAAVWDRLQRSSPAAETLHRQFHRWFDGLKTLRLLHHLRDTDFPQQEMFASICTLLKWFDFPHCIAEPVVLRGDLARQKQLLTRLRTLERQPGPPQDPC